MSDNLLIVLLVAIGILVIIDMFLPVVCKIEARRGHDNFEELKLPADPAFDKDDKLYLIGEGTIDDILPPNAKCSKSCCAQQWPLPPGLLPPDAEACAGKYIPSNMTCSNERTTGCLCVPKKLHSVLKNHGIVKN
jgi:hypothetical protein